MRKMTIEAALAWAYRDELPKSRAPAAMPDLGYGNASMGVAVAGEYWALPENLYGVVVNPSVSDDPHPDAVALHGAVERLSAAEASGGLRLDLADDWEGWADVDLCGLQGRVMADVRRAVMGEDGRLKRPLGAIIRHFAVMGVPDMSVDKPQLRHECHANGQARWFVRERRVDAEGNSYEIEVDGVDRKAKAPKAGAYRKSYLDPCPVDQLVVRAKAAIWRAALDLLMEDAGPMRDVVLLPSALPVCVWRQAPRLVLPDLRTRARAGVVGKLAGRRKAA